MDVILALVLIVVLSLTLYKASEWLIKGIRVIGDDGVISKFFLASIFVGVATSLPETFIAIVSAVENTPAVSFGNVVGANIVNITLVFPIAVLFAPFVFRVKKENFSIKTVILLLAAALFPFLLILDGSLSRYDGVFLLTMFVIYSLYLFNKRQPTDSRFYHFVHHLESSIIKPHVQKAFLGIAASLVVLLVGSHLLVQNALYLAQALSMPAFLVALFIVAPGTSLPELFVGLSAIRKREVDILYGDLFGSLVTNANFVIGLLAVIRPFSFSIIPYEGLSLYALLGSFVLFVVFSFTKQKFEKWEAVALICFYVLFLIAQSTL